MCVPRARACLRRRPSAREERADAVCLLRRQRLCVCVRVRTSSWARVRASCVRRAWACTSVCVNERECARARPRGAPARAHQTAMPPPAPSLSTPPPSSDAESALTHAQRSTKPHADGSAYTADGSKSPTRHDTTDDLYEGKKGERGVLLER
eukprot:1167005-Pleurochrysis_carterae.AAC.8